MQKEDKEALKYVATRIFTGLECNKADIDRFLASNIKYKNKERVIELLYLLNIYKDGYISPDPRYYVRNMVNALSLLNTTNDDECLSRIETVEEFVNKLKDAETNPIANATKRLADREKYENVLF
ncbi:MAG: hypothetical protein Q4G04_03255 [bacterium]|nr:hypothetical protein [bacterium]